MFETGDAHLTYSLEHKKHGGGIKEYLHTESYHRGFNPDGGVYEQAGTGWTNIQWEGMGEVSRGWRGCPERYSSSEESLSKL